MKKLVAFLLKHEYLIWILCGCALLRLPSLLEPYWYGDEGIYLTLGNGIRHGLQLYRDIYDNKPPVIYILAAISGSLFWFRFLLLTWNSVAIVLFERLAHGLLDKQKNAGTTKLFGIDFPKVQYSTVATALFALLPFFVEGNIANGEIFMIMPVIAGMLCLWKMGNDKWEMTKVIISGFCFSLAFLIKIPSAFDVFAAGVFFFVLNDFVSIKSVFTSKKPYVFVAAFLLPILITIGYYFAIGAGKDYVTAAFAQNIGYLSSWSAGTHAASNIGSSGLKNRALALLAGIVFVFIFAKKNGKLVTFLLLWFICTLFGALLSERPYPHYLIQVIPPAALLLIVCVREIRHFLSVRVLSILTAFVIFGVSLVTIKFWYYPRLPYFANYLRFVTGSETRDAYFSFFDPSLPTMYQLAQYITVKTSPADSIFIWGDDPSLYALTRRLPPGRYTSAYHIVDFAGMEETTRAILAKSPRLIILNTGYSGTYPALMGIVDSGYLRIRTFGAFVVYQRISR